MPYDFSCGSCEWTGTDPVLDAHLNPWCPRCGRPAEFSEILRMRRERRAARVPSADEKDA